MARRSFLHLVIVICITGAAVFFWLEHSGPVPWYGGPPPDGLIFPPPPPPLPERPPNPFIPPPPDVAPPPLAPPPQSIWKQRQEEVRKAFIHALTGYKKHAFPDDELLPVSGGKLNKFNGWSVTLLDSLDTIWMMGLQDEFKDAIGVVAAQNFSLPSDTYAPFFETVIRYLGGLLSAYALSKEPIFLARADDLGRALLPAFNATASGFPAYSVNTQTGRTGSSWSGPNILFAEAATCQMEYKYLAKLTGRKEYYAAVENVMEKLYALHVKDGLFPMYFSWDGAPVGEHYSVGSAADSGYEYLLKQWLQSGDVKARDQYLTSIDGIIKNLFYITPNRKLLYVTDIHADRPTHTLEHLSCFLPGVLALGAHTLDLPRETKDLHQWAAEGLAYTCYLSYVDQGTGLGPDNLGMQAGGEKWVDALAKWESSKGEEGGKGAEGVPPGLAEEGRMGRGEEAGRDYWASHPHYLLRPETVESLFVLWRTTGDAKWRERGYEIFVAIEKVAKTELGYASVAGINDEKPRQVDDMPSYFLAETLKYFYLLFDDADPYPSDKWIFNTEAHPLPVFNWTESERKAYNIF